MKDVPMWKITYPSAGRIRGNRRTLVEWFKLRRRRRMVDDLWFMH